MNKDIVNFIILGMSFLLLFGIAEILYHKLKIAAELTRKFVHLGTGLLTMLFPPMLGNQWLVLILCSSFAAILIISLKFKLLQSINGISRESVGSIAYPVSVYGCYLAFDYFNHQYIYFYIPILILAICDPIASLAGGKWPIGKYKSRKSNKTLMGSAMFFLSAFILMFIFSIAVSAEITTTRIVMRGIFVAAIATVFEAITSNGYDNITIPASVLVSLVITENVF